MQNIAAILIFLGLGSLAHADGFVCETLSNDLTIKVYNHVHASLGTRNGALMVLSDPRVNYGRKTIATFSDLNETLVSNRLTYLVKVDLRYSESSRAGENVAGTKLGQLAFVRLSLNFNYNRPVRDGEVVPALLSFQKRNGQSWLSPVQCVRYLKLGSAQ